MNRQENPLISVIMIVKNGEKFIQQALQSIYNQDYRLFEVIVVLGQSTDQTEKILESYKDIRVIHQKGSGASEAYNTGIMAANGDFVAFLSYDDLWTPNKLSVQMNFLSMHPEVFFVNCHTTYFLEPGVSVPKGFRQEWLTGSHPARIMETLLARKEVFKKVGFFNKALRTAEDVDWYCRAGDLKITGITLTNVLLKKRIHGENNSMQVEQNTKNLMFALKESVKRKKT